MSSKKGPVLAWDPEGTLWPSVSGEMHFADFLPFWIPAIDGQTWSELGGLGQGCAGSEPISPWPPFVGASWSEGPDNAPGFKVRGGMASDCATKVDGTGDLVPGTVHMVVVAMGTIGCDGRGQSLTLPPKEVAKLA